MNAFSPTERRIILEFQKGDSNSFFELYSRYAPAILGILTNILGNQMQAEKCLEVSFYTIWKQRDTYKHDRERLFTWMVKIALTCVESNSVKTKQIDLHVRELVDLSCGMDVGSYLRSEKPQQALKTYEDRPIREAIEILYFKPYSYHIAAEKMKLSVNSLKREVIRAVRQIHQLERSSK